MVTLSCFLLATSSLEGERCQTRETASENPLVVNWVAILAESPSLLIANFTESVGNSQRATSIARGNTIDETVVSRNLV
jgi:hypothetical protein